MYDKHVKKTTKYLFVPVIMLIAFYFDIYYKCVLSVIT